MTTSNRFRLKQHGIPVAWAEGQYAFGEIVHYALVYGQDAPVLIEQKVGGRWKALRRARAEAAPQ